MRIIIILTTLLTLALTSCHKHEELIAPISDYEYGDIYKLFRYNLEDIKVIEPFDAEKGLKYAINNKAEVNIPANSLTDANGNKIKGKAELSFIEIYDMGTMAITNITSEAINLGDTEKVANINLSSFFVEVLHDNRTVTLKDAEIIIPRNLMNWKEKDLTLFELAGKLSNENIVWDGKNKNELISYTPIFQDDKLNFRIKQSGWNGLFNYFGVRFENDFSKPELKANVSFSIPYGLNARNSKIFIAIEGVKGLLVDDKTALHTNIKYHFILVAANKNSDGFHYAIKTSQLLQNGANNLVTFKKEELKEANSQVLKRVINNLP